MQRELCSTCCCLTHHSLDTDLRVPRHYHQDTAGSNVRTALESLNVTVRP